MPFIGRIFFTGLLLFTVIILFIDCFGLFFLFKHSFVIFNVFFLFQPIIHPLRLYPYSIHSFVVKTQRNLNYLLSLILNIRVYKKIIISYFFIQTAIEIKVNNNKRNNFPNPRFLKLKLSFHAVPLKICLF